MSIKKSIQNTFHDVITFISGAFLGPLGKAIKASGGAILEEAAKAAVAAAEATTKSNEVKFQNAFHAVTKVLLAAGISYTTVAVRGAIEAAVAQLKSK